MVKFPPERECWRAMPNEISPGGAAGYSSSVLEYVTWRVWNCLVLRTFKIQQEEIRLSSKNKALVSSTVIICIDVFKYVHELEQNRSFNALIKHYKIADVEARVHKNKKRLPLNSLKLKNTRAAVDFILSWSQNHCSTWLHTTALESRSETTAVQL